MRSTDAKGSYNHGPIKEISSSNAFSFEFHKEEGAKRGSHHRTALGKPTPSKWDDAQKWLVGLSRGGEKSHSKTKPRNSNADDSRLISPVPQKEQGYSSDDEVEEKQNESIGAMATQYEMETKKVDFDESIWQINKHVNQNPTSAIRSVCVRDMGTEMTPIASQEPSRTATPIRATTPAARSPITSGSSTPIRCQHGGEGYQTAPTSTESRGEVNSVVRGLGATRLHRDESYKCNLSENNNPDRVQKLNNLESQAMAWDEAERAKYMARYKREEVKIQAWENHQKRKAELEMKKMEVKAERLKARTQERLANKLAATRRKAEEKRANAEAKLNEKAARTSENADYIRRTGHLPSSFSFKLPSLCW